ncbi:MAG: hypothetical protein HC919_13130, partial [Oscillatoriales cyanobacterium SM2_2_1]|nr:hypothetical protein [Oscillatoriales cyanobacterium SM2_2_1]
STADGAGAIVGVAQYLRHLRRDWASAADGAGGVDGHGAKKYLPGTVPVLARACPMGCGFAAPPICRAPTRSP